MSLFAKVFSPLYWALPASGILLLNASVWVMPSWMFWVQNLVVPTMSDQASRTAGMHLKGFNSLVSATYLLIIMINLMGLVPYVFSLSSHILFSFALGAPLWATLIMSAINKSPKSMIASLLPSNTPTWLCPPLIIIETVSVLVRPVTLSFRLAANMTAGHVILGLVGSCLSSLIFSSTLCSGTLMVISTAYTIFETGICLIQAYIFCLLLSLYADDHPKS